MSIVFFFNDTATTEIYTLSLHDALPICPGPSPGSPPDSRSAGPTTPRGDHDRCAQAGGDGAAAARRHPRPGGLPAPDRKSTRLNSSHANISYAVFCLKKKKIKATPITST